MHHTTILGCKGEQSEGLKFTTHGECRYEDGTTTAARFPPPNGDTLALQVTQGQGSCEVVYDGTAAPMVRATAGAGCDAAVCEVTATYSSPCRAQAVTASTQVRGATA